MAIAQGALHDLLVAGFPDSDIKIEDLRGDGDHYAATIVSPAFQGKTRVARHRMVNVVLDGVLGVQLHALAIHAFAPSET